MNRRFWLPFRLCALSCKSGARSSGPSNADKSAPASSAEARSAPLAPPGHKPPDWVLALIPEGDRSTSRLRRASLKGIEYVGTDVTGHDPLANVVFVELQLREPPGEFGVGDQTQYVMLPVRAQATGQAGT